jgi:hypothetical protein
MSVSPWLLIRGLKAHGPSPATNDIGGALTRGNNGSLRKRQPIIARYMPGKRSTIVIPLHHTLARKASDCSR